MEDKKNSLVWTSSSLTENLFVCVNVFIYFSVPPTTKVVWGLGFIKHIQEAWIIQDHYTTLLQLCHLRKNKGKFSACAFCHAFLSNMS